LTERSLPRQDLLALALGANLGPRVYRGEPVTDRETRPGISERFNDSHAARLSSVVLERVHRAAFGDDYAIDTHTNGFYSLTTLARLCDALKLASGRTLVDLGCGHGGPGLWVARRTGVSLIGIDISPGGVALGNERTMRAGLADQARFAVGDMTATGLSDASCDAALSLDVLLFVPDKAAALHEVARILKAGGTLGFTSWEQSGFSERLGSEQCADYRPLIEAVGMIVDSYEEPPDWRHQQRALAEGLIAAEDELSGEIGSVVAGRFATMARGVLTDMPSRRYVRVLAHKP
jgi:SAM-dependent methyltransferase